MKRKARIYRQGYGSFAVIIPKPFIEFLEWDNGDDIEISLDIKKKEVVIRKKGSSS